MYHKIAELNSRSKWPGHYVSPAAFGRQMAALKALGFQSIPLSNLNSQEAKKPIVITFDDGYENFYQHALPSLKKHNLTATVFLVSQQVGGSNAWDVAEGDVEERLMTADQIAASQNQGIEFGSHTRNHANLAKASPETAWDEIANSKIDLEELLNQKVETFAYPYGAETGETRKMVEKAGYRVACSTRKGTNDTGTDPYALKRINIRRDTALPFFVLKIWRGLRFDR
jgi:peptidoglycan/xylan/chitin deacetylase (PgdA/CDA1 family)